MGMYASMIVLKTFCDGSVAAMRVFMRGVRPLGSLCFSDELRGRAPRAGRGSTDLRHNRRTCCLPSGLSPSVQELHLVNRPLAAVGSRTVTAGSEFHRPRSTCHEVCRTPPCCVLGGLSWVPSPPPLGVSAEIPWTGTAHRCCTVRVPTPTPERLRGLARSSPWRWRALAFDLHRRPLHGPEHTVHATVERGVGLAVTLADGEPRRDPAVRNVAGLVHPGDAGRGTPTVELPYAWELPVEVDADGFVVRRPAGGVSEDPVW